LPKKTEIIVYRLVQECCNNIGKHSSASSVNISLTAADGMLKLHVEDNGVGFSVAEAQAKRDSFGLSGMHERVTLMGGRFMLQSWAAASTPGTGTGKAAGKGNRGKQGTEIRIELPIPMEQEIA
jgi:two-component system sensor histidine kinase DegS